MRHADGLSDRRPAVDHSVLTAWFPTVPLQALVDPFVSYRIDRLRSRVGDRTPRCPLGRVGRACSRPLRPPASPGEGAMWADRDGATALHREEPRPQGDCFRRDGTVRARRLAWLLPCRADSHTRRGDRRWLIGSTLTFVEVGGKHAGRRAPGRRCCPGWRRGVPSGLERSCSRTANRKRASACQRRLLPIRSGAAEGVGDARRKAPVQIDHSGRRGPFSGL